MTSVINAGQISIRRERAIIRFLTEREPEGSSLREIFDAVTKKIGDDVSRPAYYKVMDRLEAAGLVETYELEGRPERVYRVTPTISSANPLTLDDIYEMLPFFETSEAIARVADAQDYFEEMRETTIRTAAKVLMEEDPRELFFGMILDMATALEKQHEIVNDESLADAAMQQRLKSEYFQLESVVYRALSLPEEAINLPPYSQYRQDRNARIIIDESELRRVLSLRVFGETFLRQVDISGFRGSRTRQELNVSGSDGSIHAGTISLKTAQGFIEDEGNIVTFNNAIVFMRLSPTLSMQHRADGMVHSAPMTRQTLDDPTYKGMVLVPFMYPELSEAEYEHMARCATDVVQLRVDEAVFSGSARDLTTGQLLPAPSVHIRDGTVTPQERYFNHYYRPDSYGEMVREGISLQRQVLLRSLTAKNPPVFAGAVKSTQLKIFSRALNWFIARGSKKRLGKALDPNWDARRAAYISDNHAMTVLLTSLPENANDGKYYISCVLLRQFHSLTEFYRARGDREWLDFFEKEKQNAKEQHERRGLGLPLPYHVMVPLDEDPYVFMCSHADYCSFYIGYTAGDPPPQLPRYEFLTSIRGIDGEKKLDDANKIVDQALTRIVDAIDATGVSADRDHNFLRGITLLKLIPYVVMRAHEYAKTLGKKLEMELRSAVIRRLIEVRRMRLPPSDVEVRPVSVRKYLERFVRAKKALPGPSASDTEEVR